MSRDLTREKNPMWGKKHSESTKQKISEANKGREPNSGSFKPGPRYDLRKRVLKTCVECQTEFEVKISHDRQVCCSKTCGYKYRARKQIGKKIHTSDFKERLRRRNWRGGVTSKNRSIRRSPEYKEWRMKVFQRDLYTCQRCGKTGGELQADHDLPFSLFEDLRLEILNGQTLCKSCHATKPRIISHLLEIHMLNFNKN